MAAEPVVDDQIPALGSADAPGDVTTRAPNGTESNSNECQPPTFKKTAGGASERRTAHGLRDPANLVQTRRRLKRLSESSLAPLSRC